MKKIPFRTMILTAAMIAAGGPAAADHEEGHDGGPPEPDPPPVNFAPIQPGAHWGHAVEDGCTLNFVFRDIAGRLYIGAAGHCANAAGGVGVEATLRDGSRVGEVVFAYSEAILDGFPEYVIAGGDLPTDDFALIAIDEERYGDVSPVVRQFGGPTGIADPEVHGTGERVAMYGNGLVIRDIGLYGREGILTRHDERTYTTQMVFSAGDSGSPLIVAGSGEAVGIVSGASLRSPFWAGPTISRVLELTADAGFDLELVTAPLRHEDISDGRDCADQIAPMFQHHYQSQDDPTQADPNNVDRFAICILLNGNPLLFWGGEVRAEEEPSPYFRSPPEHCGSMLILSNQYGDQDWHDPGPDGQWGTDDDHTCN